MSKQCKNCGAIMQEDDMFCEACGSAYQNESEGNNESINNDSPFYEIEEQLSHCQSIDEVDVIREKIEREYDDARDLNYLIGIVDKQYRRIKSEKDRGVIDDLAIQIESCNTLEGAFALRDRISEAKISHRDRYSLMRSLRIKTTRQHSTVVSQGLKLDVSERSTSFWGIIGFIFFAGIGYAVYKFVPIHWMSVVGKWGMYAMLAFAAMGAIWFVFSILKWTFASKEKKKSAQLFAMMKKKELYFEEKDYIVYDSDVRYLRSDEISNNGSAWKYKARFEILARHGAKYNSDMDADLRNFFSEKSWYENCPERKVNDSDLNKYEVANYNLLIPNEKNPIKYIE